MSLAVLQNQLVLNIEALRAELSQMRLRGASLHHRYEPQLQVRLHPVMCAQGAWLGGQHYWLQLGWAPEVRPGSAPGGGLEGRVISSCLGVFAGRPAEQGSGVGTGLS